MRLEIESVSKRYAGGIWALRDFSLELGPGLHGLLGPNGAGKSTLMRILATIIRPSSGRVRWRGSEVVSKPDPLREVLGYLPQDFGIYPNLSATEFLEYLAAVKGLGKDLARKRIDALLDLVNLRDVGKRRLGGFSGGMRQRLGIAQALLNDPELLILDEPTAGLDPGERVRFRNLLTELASDRVVLLSTHIVSDVETTTSAITLISDGRLVRSGTPESFTAELRGRVWSCALAGAELTSIKSRYLVTQTRRLGDEVVVRMVADTAPHPNATKVEPRLEDAYLALTAQ